MSNGIYEYIELSIESQLAILTLKRPQALNALTLEMLTELISALDTVSASDSIRALLITGEGRGFCAGADLSGPSPSFERSDRDNQGQLTLESMEKGFNLVASKIYHMPKPVITAVNGAAAGAGVSIALAGDICIAGESGYFMQVFIPQLGIIPDMGATWLVPRLIGSARARAAMLLGEKIDAKKAENWGLIYRVTADDQLMKTAKEYATKLAEGATFGISQLKKVLDESGFNTFDQQLQLEAEVQKECCGSSDFVEGVMAFASKRKPEFTGEQHATSDRYPPTTDK